MRYIVLACILLLSGNAFGRSTNTLQQPISINVTQKSLDDIFVLISQQSGVLFSYNPQEVNTTQAVSVKADAEPLYFLLERLLGSSIEYEQHGNYIILLPVKIAGTEAAEEVIVKYIPEIKEPLFIEKKIAPAASGSSELICHSSIVTTNNDEMKKQLTALLLTFATISAANEATAQQPEANNHKPFQASIIYPIGTNGTKSADYTYNLSINLMGGVTGGLTSVEFGGFFNKNFGVTSGAQLAGMANLSKHLEGVQLSGVINISASAKKATQVAGVANFIKSGEAVAQLAGIINRSDSAKVQLAGIVNTAKSGEVSAQLAGVINLAESSKLQLASIANSSNGKENTVQAAGIVNIAKQSNTQTAGITNIADTAMYQVAGIVNKARKSKVQVGLINISDEADVQVGLINISKNGFIEAEIASGELLHTTISLRSGSKRFYGIVSLGYSLSDEFWGIGVGGGKTIELSSKVGLNIEAVYYGFASKKFKTEPYNDLTQLRPLFYYKVSKNLKLFAGPVLNQLTHNTSTQNELKIIAPYTIWKKTNKNSKQEGWIGFTAGIRF